jgi:hypothetical protein
MGGSDAPLTVDDSIPKMLDVVKKADFKQSGQFVEYTGAVVPA